MIKRQLYTLAAAAMSLMAWQTAALALDGIIFERSGENAGLLVLDDTKLNAGATLFLDQPLTKATGQARVTGPSGLGVRLKVPSGAPFKVGPVTINVISNPAAQDPGKDEAEIGDLNTPLFTLDDPQGGAAGGQTVGAAGGQQDRILSYVREWIAVAEPPQNAQPGYRLRYSKWGQFHGTTPTGTISINAKPDDAAGLPYDRFLWTRRPTLPSLNHCILRDYVNRKLAGGDVAACRGAVASAGGAAAPGRTVTHREGQHADGKTPIGGNTEIIGEIQQPGDRDEFVFDAPHHGEWKVRVGKEPPGVNLHFGVYPAPNGNWLPDMTPKKKGVLTVDLPKPGSYVLRITGKNNRMQSLSPYRVRVSFARSPDVHEPNTGLKAAKPVAGTGTLIGTILPRAERDEFLFDAPHHGEWKIRIGAEPDGVKLNTGVYPAPNGNWIPNMTPKEKGVLTVDLPKPGRYVLRVTGNNNQMRSVDPYRLNHVFTRSPDVHEPNTGLKAAKPIAGTGTLIGTILPRAERDEFLFDAPHHGEWKINIGSEPDGVALKLGVYPAPNGNWIPDMSPKNKGLLTVDLPKPGRYVLRVTGKNSHMRSVKPYELRHVFTPSPDLHEPNASIKVAKPIRPGGTIVGTILPRGDRDEYPFDVGGPRRISVRILSTPGNLPLSMGIYPAPNGNWLRDLAPKDKAHLVVDLRKAGRYVLRVTGANRHVRSVVPYRLSMGLR